MNVFMNGRIFINFFLLKNDHKNIMNYQNKTFNFYLMKKQK